MENLFTRQNEEQKYALLPSLLKKIPTFDFAIILATPDELVLRVRSGQTDEYKGMRDNVIFEMGLCVMALGCNKTIILQHKDVYLFDDLIGVSDIHSKNSLLSASGLGVFSAFKIIGRWFRIGDSASDLMDIHFLIGVR